MHETSSTTRLAFIIVFVVIKRVSTNLISIRSARIYEELVYKDGTTVECVENRNTSDDPLLDSVGSNRCFCRVENEESIWRSDISTNDQ